MTRQIYDAEMLDITSPDIVEVVIREDRKVVWVNVDGKCAFRACKIGKFELSDQKAQPEYIFEIIKDGSRDGRRKDLMCINQATGRTWFVGAYGSMSMKDAIESFTAFLGTTSYTVEDHTK